MFGSYKTYFWGDWAESAARQFEVYAGACRTLRTNSSRSSNRYGFSNNGTDG
jgi:hypothetical protein